MTGLTTNCAYCGRPIAAGAMMSYGNGGEPYHYECTQSPKSERSQTMGCICPPTSEQTCQAAACPRRGIQIPR